MPEIIIKGELHSSRGDFHEERELLAQGIDTLVIEGSENETTYRWLHSWFGVAMLIFEYLFARFLYTDSQTLVDIAKGQGAEVVYTRDNDAELVQNSSGLVLVSAFFLFYFLLIGSVVYGLILGHRVGGAVLVIASGLAPVLLLRVYEMRKENGNRDRKIAQKIADAAEGGGRTVAIMGQKHAENVPEYLPDNLDPEIRDPQYGFISMPMIRDLAWPMVTLIGTMSVVYPVILLVVDIYLTLI